MRAYETLSKDEILEIVWQELGDGVQLPLELFPEPEMTEEEILDSCRRVRREIFGERYPTLAGHYQI